MTLGYLTEAAAGELLTGGTMPAAFYAQQHDGAPGLAFDANIGPDSRRIGPFTFTVSGNTITNTNAVSIIGAAADTSLEYVTLWDASSGGSAWWVLPLTGAPVAVTAGQEVGFYSGDIILTLDSWTE